MTLVRNLIILALILGLVLVALKLIVPMIAWVFQLVVTLTCLVAIGIAVIYLYQKLRT